MDERTLCAMHNAHAFEPIIHGRYVHSGATGLLRSVLRAHRAQRTFGARIRSRYATPPIWSARGWRSDCTVNVFPARCAHRISVRVRVVCDPSHNERTCARAYSHTFTHAHMSERTRMCI